MRWERRWETGLTRTAEGDEERESKRSVGLKSIRYTAQPVSLEETAQLLAAIKSSIDIRDGKACAPYWSRSSVLAADCSATTVTLEAGGSGSLVWDWAALEYIFLFDQELRLWEVRQVQSVLGNVLTLVGGAVARTYKAGTLVWPLIFGELSVENAKSITNHRAQPLMRISENELGLSKVETSCPALTTYLGRPVAPFGNEIYPLESDQAQTFQYDLRKLLLGFGAASYRPLQNHLVNGWDLTAILEGAEQIKMWDCFTAGLPGRAAGFWLSDTQCIFDITNVTDVDTMRVVDSDLATTWASDPAVYVIFRKIGSADQIARITAVLDLGGGVEEVTIDTALALDETWIAYRLRYVRLASDVERAESEVENRQHREIRVVELPEEYAAVETGRAAVWLYTFWIETPGGNTPWRYTSNADNLTSNGLVFAAGNLTHGPITRSAGAEKEEVTVEGDRVDGNVFALFSPLILPLNLWVKIEETTMADLDTTEVLFQGIAQRGPMTGRKASIKFWSFLDALGAEMPNFTLQHRCNYRVFGPGCLLDRDLYKVSAVIRIISADRRVVTLSGAGLTGANPIGAPKYQNNYWALGWLEYGAGLTFQLATILKSEAIQVDVGGGVMQDGARVTLNLPLQAAAVVTNGVVVTPGCDGIHTTCQDYDAGTNPDGKFDNYVNFGGQPFIPKNNPTLPAAMSGNQSGAKK